MDDFGELHGFVDLVALRLLKRLAFDFEDLVALHEEGNHVVIEAIFLERQSVVDLRKEDRCVLHLDPRERGKTY